MKTKHLLKLLALNLALTTVFAAALPYPSPSQSGGGGGRSPLMSMSSVRIVARMQQQQEARKLLDNLKKIKNAAEKQAIINDMREDAPELLNAAAATAGAGASDEKIFDTLLDMMEKEYMEETLAIARDLHAGATPTPAPGSRIH